MIAGRLGSILNHRYVKGSILVETVSGWWEDKAPRLGAALAFYTVLSLAPLLVIVTPIVSAVFGAQQARDQITAQFERLIGKQGAQAVSLILETEAPDLTPGRFTTALSLAVFLFGATGVFAELQESLNTIWEVTPRPGAAAVWDFFRQRFLSFTMVMGICFLLLVSMVLTA